MRRSLIKKEFIALITSMMLFGLEVFTVVLAQNSLIELAAKVDKSIINIGDRVTYTLTITRDKTLRIEQPGPGANLGMFEIKDYEIHKPIEKDDRIIEQFDYSIAVFDTGKFVIPPFPVAFFPSDTSDKFEIISSEPIEIFVESLLSADNADIKDIKPPLLLPSDYTRLIILIGSAVLLIVAGILGYIYYKKRRKGEPLFRKEVIRPAHEIAYEDLEKLLNSSFLNDKDFKAFYSKLSDILRSYIENRFFINAMEETTSELMESMAEVDLPNGSPGKCQEVLNLSDLVKFAKYVPAETETDQSISNVRDFIDATHLEFEPVEKIEENESSNEVELTIEKANIKQED
jgi:hypothetical protein